MELSAVADCQQILGSLLYRVPSPQEWRLLLSRCEMVFNCTCICEYMWIYMWILKGRWSLQSLLNMLLLKTGFKNLGCKKKGIKLWGLGTFPFALIVTGTHECRVNGDECMRFWIVAVNSQLKWVLISFEVILLLPCTIVEWVNTLNCVTWTWD